MKSLIYTIILLLAFPFFYSCESEMMGYEGNSGIYFMVQKKPLSNYGDPELFEYVDTTFVEFAKMIGDEAIVPLRVRVMGDVAGYDRHFSIGIDQHATTARPDEDYVPFVLEQTVLANERQVDIPCRTFRTDKLYQHPDTVIYLTLKLHESADFSLPLPQWKPFGNLYGDPNKSVSVIRHVIAINDALGMPAVWPGYTKYWGEYSGKKLLLMCELFLMTAENFEQMTTTEQTRALIMGQNLDRYLKEKAKDGKTVYEDYKDKNGDLVKMKAGTNI